MKLTDPRMPIEMKLEGLKHMARHIIEIIEAMEADNLGRRSLMPCPMGASIGETSTCH